MKRKVRLAVCVLLVILAFCGCTAERPRSVSGTVVEVTQEGYLLRLEQRGRDALRCEMLPLSRAQIARQDVALSLGDRVQLEYRRAEKKSGGWQLSGLRVEPCLGNANAGMRKDSPAVR